MCSSLSWVSKKTVSQTLKHQLYDSFWSKKIGETKRFTFCLNHFSLKTWFNRQLKQVLNRINVWFWYLNVFIISLNFIFIVILFFKFIVISIFRWYKVFAINYRHYCKTEIRCNKSIWFVSKSHKICINTKWDSITRLILLFDIIILCFYFDSSFRMTFNLKDWPYFEWKDKTCRLLSEIVILLIECKYIITSDIH